MDNTEKKIKRKIVFNMSIYINKNKEILRKRKECKNVKIRKHISMKAKERRGNINKLLSLSVYAEGKETKEL